MTERDRERIYRVALAQLKAEQDAQMAERIRRIKELAALYRKAA